MEVKCSTQPPLTLMYKYDTHSLTPHTFSHTSHILSHPREDPNHPVPTPALTPEEAGVLLDSLGVLTASTLMKVRTNCI